MTNAVHLVQIAYFVHDINDPAVARRVTMLRAAGANVVVAGFRRDERAPVAVAGAPCIDLGRTRDGDLKQRAARVVANLLRPAAILRASAGADVVIGRNLESLALARRARRRARLVYECLDIHRSLLGASRAARAIQRVEGWLLRSVDLLIVSSPAFTREYFARRPTLTAPVLLVENKLLAGVRPSGPAREAPAGPPWVIGWLGNLRCRRTFEELTALAARFAGQVEILIAGRPSPAVFDGLEAMVAAAPHCRYLGPYAAGDLAGIYAQCHFAWAIDYFEEGLNSRWLLPNKLYEASAFGVVPIALASVETGRWLDRHGAGVLLGDEAPAEQLATLLAGLDADRYAALRDAIGSIPAGDLIAGADDDRRLLDAVAGR